MIVSASRRTDLPAFYSAWFLNRLAAGWALVRHPRNPRLVRRVPLASPATRLVVFWTRDPRPLLPALGRLEEAGLDCTFLFTVTPYGPDLERALPPLDERLAAFRALAERIGPRRVDWRYDPILLAGGMDAAWHRRAFARLAASLRGHTHRCIVSFLEPYGKTRRNLAKAGGPGACGSGACGSGPGGPEPGEPERAALLAALAGEAERCGMRLQTCAVGGLPGTPAGGGPAGLAGACIDGRLPDERTDGPRPPPARRDPGQRPLCRCAPSVDLGAYDTCLHGCLYCYATSSAAAAARRHALHDPASPLLVGTLQPGERITEWSPP